MGWPSFGNNNLNQMFPIVADETYTASGGILDHSALQNCQFSNILEMSGVDVFLEVMPQHLHQVDVRSLTGPLQKAYFLLLSHSVIDLPLCTGLLSCCISHPLLCECCVPSKHDIMFVPYCFQQTIFYCCDLHEDLNTFYNQFMQASKLIRKGSHIFSCTCRWWHYDGVKVYCIDTLADDQYCSGEPPTLWFVTNLGDAAGHYWSSCWTSVKWLMIWCYWRCTYFSQYFVCCFKMSPFAVFYSEEIIPINSLEVSEKLQCQWLFMRIVNPVPARAPWTSRCSTSLHILTVSWPIWTPWGNSACSQTSPCGLGIVPSHATGKVSLSLPYFLVKFNKPNHPATTSVS